jgi:hypothetical protein
VSKRSLFLTESENKSFGSWKVLAKAPPPENLSCGKSDESRVARWFSFKPKIPVFVYFGRAWAEKFGIFLGHLVFFAILVYFMAIWYFYGHVGVLFFILVCSFLWLVIKIWQPWTRGAKKSLW